MGGKKDGDEKIAACVRQVIGWPLSWCCGLHKAVAISEAPAVEVTLESGDRLELSPARAANALTSRLASSNRAEAADARRALLDLMRAGANDYPIPLLSAAGADLADPRTVEALVTRLSSLVDDLEQAVDDDRSGSG